MCNSFSSKSVVPKSNLYRNPQDLEMYFEVDKNEPRIHIRPPIPYASIGGQLPFVCHILHRVLAIDTHCVVTSFPHTPQKALSSSTDPTSGTCALFIRQANHLPDPCSFLLILERTNLLSAIPPLLFGTLKARFLDLFG